MRKIFLTAALIILITSVASAQTQIVELNDRADTVGYVVGWTYGDLIVRQGLAVNQTLLTNSVEDRLEGDSQLLDKDQTNDIMMRLQTRYREAMQASGGNPQGIDPTAIFGTVSDASEKISTWNDSLSYAIGQNIGESIAAHGYEMSAHLIMTGMQQRLAAVEPMIRAGLMDTINQQLIADQKNAALKRGVAFLEKNAARENVTVTPSGLQYEVVTPGTGAQPTTESQVTVHYTGTLIDGTVFDSSVERGEPATFGVTQVISGWTEALQMMKEGAKWRLYIPTELAYGEKGAPGGAIGPNEALIFEVELLEVN